MPKIEGFIDAAVGYYGTRWKDHGRSRTGLDCVGLIILAGRDSGFFAPDFDFQEYTRFPTGFSLVETVSRFLTKKPLGQVADGNILCHRDQVFPCHASIYWNRPGYGPSIIHAYLGGLRRVTIDPFAEWRGQTYPFVFSLPGAE